MQTPIIIVNFKNYPEACGTHAVSLAKLCEKVAHESGASIAVAVGALDLARVIDAVNIPVLAQHVDAAGYGSSTGWVNPAAVKAAGAVGTLLNHAEHPLDTETLTACHAAAKGAGLETIICAATADDARAVASLRPDFVAVEPPELIGGDLSITTADPDCIARSLAAVPDIPLLVGAGVKAGDDVKKAIEMGTSGVLLASGVVKATDQKAALRELVRGLEE